MLIKIAGVCLLLIGVALALPLLGMVLVGILSFVWLLVKVALVVGLCYWGWCWFKGCRPNWPKGTAR
jgi:hypothetical protein